MFCIWNIIHQEMYSAIVLQTKYNTMYVNCIYLDMGNSVQSSHVNSETNGYFLMYLLSLLTFIVIFCMKLSKCNESLFSSVDTHGLVLYHWGIIGTIAEYTPNDFPDVITLANMAKYCMLQTIDKDLNSHKSNVGTIKCLSWGNLLITSLKSTSI